jgi:PAS domain S-box-containing protein
MAAHYLKKELYELIKRDERIFDFIQEGSLDGLWYWDLEEPENEWMSPRFWEVLGYAPKEMPHKASAWKDIINQDDLQVAIDNFNKHVADPNHPYDQELRYIHKDGSTVWVRCRGFAICNAEGKAIRMLGAHQDITSLKQTEEKFAIEHQKLKDTIENYRSLAKETADNLSNLQAATNITTIFLDKALNVFEFTPSDHTKEYASKDSKQTLTSINQHFQINNLKVDCEKVLASLNAIEKEVTCTHGLVWWMRISPYKTLEGRIEGLVITFTDISEKKQQEAELEVYRNHLEELVEQKSQELYRSNIRYKQLVETAVDAIYLIDERGIVVDTNHQATLMLEKSKEEIIGQTVEVIDNNFPVEAFLAFWDPIPYEESRIFETSHTNKAGVKIPIEISGKKYKLDGKTYYYGIARDISEQKDNEKKLLQKQYHLENAQELGKIGSWEIDIINNELSWTDESYRIFGIPVGTEMTFELFINRVHPDDRGYVDKKWNAAIFGKEAYDITHRIVMDNDEVKWVREKAEFLYDNVGKCIKGIGFTQDITEEKKAEEKINEQYEELKSRNEFISSILERLPIGFATNEIDTNNVTYINDKFAEIYGWDKKDFPNTADFFMKVFPDENYRTLLQERIIADMQSGDPERMRWDKLQIRTKSGDTKYVNALNIPIFDQNVMVSTVQDVTKQIAYEKEIEQSEAKFRGVFEDSNVGIALGSNEGTVLEVNDEYLRMTGYLREEFIHLNFADITHPDDLAKEIPLFEQFHSGEIDKYRIEKRLRAKNGQYIWLDSAISCRRDAKGNVDLTIALVVDITETKRANETVKVFFDQPMNIHLISTIEGEILRINEGWIEILGFSKQESVGRNIMEFIHQDDIESTVNELKDLEGGKRTFYFENRYKHKNGNYVTLAWSAIYNTSGKLLHAIAKDITQQKMYHEQLAQSEERYKALSENAKHIIFTHTHEGEITYINKYGIDFLNMPKEHIVGTNIMDLIQDEQEKIKIRERIQSFIASKINIHQYELQLTLPSGKESALEIIGSQINPGEEDSLILITAYDITERKNTEIQKQHKLEIENLISRVSTYFIQTDNIESSIHKAFEAIGAVNNASRIYLSKVDETIGTISVTHEWCNQGVSAEKEAFQDLSVSLFPWLMKKMYANEVINIPNVSKMSTEAAAEKEILEQQGVRSFIVVPIFIKNKLFGYIGFDNIEDSDNWSSSDVYLLEMLATILSNAITRNISEQKILEQNEQYEALNEELQQTNDELISAIRREEEINDRFDKAIKATSDGLWDWNLINNDVYYSPRWKSMLGYRENELSNDFSVWETLTYPEDVKRSWILLNDLIEGKIERFDIEFKMKHKNGRWVDIHSRANVFRNEEGKAIRVVGTHTDITLKKKAEDKLRESEEKLRLAIDNSPLGITINDMEGNFVSANKAYEKIVGYTKDELKGMNFFDLTHPDYLPKNRELFDAMAQNKAPGFAIDKKYIHKSGKQIDVRIHAGSIHNEEGEVLFGMAFTEDVTENKRLSQRNIMLSKAVESSPVIVVITNKEGNIEYVNPFFTKVTGYTSHEVIGKNPRLLKSGNHSDAFYSELWECISSKNTWQGEFHNKKKNGELYWENAAISPILNDQGEIIQFVSVKEDITKLKTTLADLEIAKEKAEEANALKTEFLHNMSHEVRTPLNGILGFSNLLNELDDCSEIQLNYTSIIQNSSKQLLAVIDDILEISTLETKQISIHEEELDVNQFIMEIFSIYDLKAKERKLPLYIHKGLPNTNCLILTDRAKLNKILSNLLDNAFKFTSIGKIEFGYVVQNSNIVFYVKDSGIGISIDKQSKIFERFSQESSNTAQTYGGLGLGLSIAKENSELLGGTIRVESKKDKGTTFFVELPYKPVYLTNGDQNVEGGSSNSEDEKTINILIAEDEEVNFLFLEVILDRFDSYNVNIQHVINGEEAVERCLNDYTIDLVLMDIKMPVMNGYEATKKIKAIKPDLPIIAQTAYSTASEKDLALKCGCDDFISKPINKKEFLQLIIKHIETL